MVGIAQSRRGVWVAAGEQQHGHRCSGNAVWLAFCLFKPLSAHGARGPRTCRARCTKPRLAKRPVSPELHPLTARASRVCWRCNLQVKAAWKPLQRDAAVNTSRNYGQDFLLYLSTPLYQCLPLLLSESWCQGTKVHHLILQDVARVNRIALQELLGPSHGTYQLTHRWCAGRAMHSPSQPRCSSAALRSPGSKGGCTGDQGRRCLHLHGFFAEAAARAAL